MKFSILAQRFSLAGVLLPALLPICVKAAEPDFIHEIAPILRTNCFKCHNDTKKKAGLSINDEAAFRAGSEDGPIVEPGDAEASMMYQVISTDDEDERMPPKGAGLDEKQVSLIRDWITAGAKWEPGFMFQKPAYEPPLKPRVPVLPTAVAGRENPIDRIIDHYLAEKKLPAPAALDDTAFLRRVHLDLTGLLPDATEVTSFAADESPDKRAKKIDALLANNTAYAEHWLTFWNDLLRNDYTGTGYITGGRKQISGWLYKALVSNMPYDEFVRQLVAPSPESEGFAAGITWRGNVSAAQITPMQYAQSVGQTFLGLNLKCASCHDSFVDRWKLSEAYGLAAIYSETPLEMSRCDKPTGKMAKAAWLFPEIGTVDASLPRPERLKQLAALITHPENGRTSRTITNRLWQRLMGRGIVHPVDAMQSPPWNEDLLDFLGSNLTENKYDLKQTLRLICLSEAYQSQSESFGKPPADGDFVYQGPRAKRLTAEEFTDAIWQLCGIAPSKFDAPVERPVIAGTEELPVFSGQASWIWTDTGSVPAGKIATFRKKFSLTSFPEQAFAVVSADNSFDFLLNGQKILSGDNWGSPQQASITTALKVGENEILIIATNGGAGDNPAAAAMHIAFRRDGKWAEIVTDTTWEAADGSPADSSLWKPAVTIPFAPWDQVSATFPQMLVAGSVPQLMVRASLLNSDLLMRTLGRPNREQIVATRPDNLTTLEAMDLNNGAILDKRLSEGANALLTKNFTSSKELASYLWRSALSRDPTTQEMEIVLSQLGDKPTPVIVQDLLWSILMMPEFQIIR